MERLLAMRQEEGTVAAYRRSGGILADTACPAVQPWRHRPRFGEVHCAASTASVILYVCCVDAAKMMELSARWWHEVWRDGNVDVIDEILTDPFVRHTSAGTSVSSLGEYKQLVADLQRTLHRPETTVDACDIVGDRIWTRATSRGVNLKTGERSVVTWLMVQRVVHDRIAEHWALTVQGVEWGH